MEATLQVAPNIIVREGGWESTASRLGKVRTGCKQSLSLQNSWVRGEGGKLVGVTCNIIVT